MPASNENGGSGIISFAVCISVVLEMILPSMHTTYVPRKPAPQANRKEVGLDHCGIWRMGARNAVMTR